MKTVLAPICAVAAWVAFLYKAIGLRKDIQAPLVALCASFASLAMAYTLSVPVVSAGVDVALGVQNLAAFGIQASFVSYSAATQVLLLLWAHSRNEATPRILWRVALLMAAVAVMASLFLAAGIRQRAPHFLLTHVGNPLIAAELLFYVIALAVGLGGMLRMSLRYARHAGRTWLRHGLRATALGAGVHLGYCATRLVDIVLVRVGGDPASLEALVPLCAGTGSLLVVYGLTVPAWAQRLAAPTRWARRCWTYHHLRPLWTELYRTFPEIALDPPRSHLLDRFAVTDLGFRLNRRVIEIRDGQRTLRAWEDPEQVRQVLREAENAGLTGISLRATVEAAALAHALQARSSGLPGAESAANRTAPAAPEPETNGGGLATEASYLALVSRAFASSPHVPRRSGRGRRGRQLV